MGWASNYIQQLQAGKTVQFRPRGGSMKGRVESGQLCTVAPSDSYEVGDVVLCIVKGNEYLHLIKAIKGKQFQIGNNVGGVNGWISQSAIYGKLVEKFTEKNL